MLFLLVYFGGWAYFDFAWLLGGADEPSLLRKLYAVTFSVWVMASIIAYVVIALAPKSSNEFQRFSSCLSQRNLRGAVADLPSWLVALGITLLALLAHLILVAVSPASQGATDFGDLLGGFEFLENTPLDMLAIVSSAILENTGDWRVPLGLLGFYGLLVRDLSVVLLLNLGSRSGRADLTALLYLVVLYAVLPALLYVIDWDSQVAYLLPSVRFGDGDALAVHWLQAMAMLALLTWRWQRMNAEKSS